MPRPGSRSSLCFQDRPSGTVRVAPVKISGKNTGCTFHDRDQYLQKRGIQGIGVDKRPGTERAGTQVEGKLLTKKDLKNGLDQGCFRFGFSADAFAYAASAAAFCPRCLQGICLIVLGNGSQGRQVPGCVDRDVRCMQSRHYSRPSSTRIPARFDWMTGISELIFCARARSASWSASL